MDELKIYLVWLSSTVWRGRFALKFFAQSIWKKKHYKIFISYFHKFSVQDHLHEHYSTFKQLIGKTVIDIESAVANKQKICDFASFKTFYKLQFFTTVKDIFKTHFGFSVGIT